MKKIFIFISLMLSILVLAFSKGVKVNASTDLDYIESYKIIVTPNDDGTLNMDYEIKWRVLDSSSEGPLEWVKIGVANKYVDNIEILSSDIKSAYFYYDSGSYIRLDLKRKFYQDSVVDLHFSFVQSRIFSVNDNDIEYGFIPGWFPDIRVGRIDVYWAGTKEPIYNDAHEYIDGYYHWNDTLDYDETIKCCIKYSKEAFPTIDLSKDYSSRQGSFFQEYGGIVIFVLAVLMFIVIIIISNAKKDHYQEYRGYAGTYYYYRPWWIPYHATGVDNEGKKIENPTVKSYGSGHGGGGSSCACACACACAGGGRAGCARKDFYPPKVKIEDINNSK